MRVAIIAGSMAIAIRVAKEIENLPTVDVSIVLCNLRMRPPLLRWARELLLALKSFQWLAFAGRVYDYVKSRKLMILRRPLDDSISTERLRSLQSDVGLHAANVIYREPTISAFRLGILNAHIGILPKYRGRCVVEWSVLQGDPTGVTVFFIDSGIDTGGRIIFREFIPSKGWKRVGGLKNMLFWWDACLYRKALEALMQPGVRVDSNDGSMGQRYLVVFQKFC